MPSAAKSKSKSKKAVKCTKWIRITCDEAYMYPDENGRISNYKTCGTCKTGTSILHAVHVESGDALCTRCGKDIDLVWLCRDRKNH